MSRLKITFILHDAHLHGATRSAIDLADLIRDKEIDTEVIIPTKGLAESLLLKKKNIFRKVYFPLLVSFNHRDGFVLQFKRLISAFQNFKHLVNHVKQTKPDIIYINTVANYWTLLLKFFVKAKFVWHIREFGEPDHKMYFDFRGFIFSFFKKNPDRVIFNSNAVQQYFKTNFNIQGEVIYNGVYLKKEFDDNLQSRNLDKYSTQHSVINIGIIGNISKGKGQLNVLKALSILLQKYNNLFLYIVGDGVGRKDLEDYIKENKLFDFVKITGFTTHVEDYYKKLDIVIVNSISEAFGRVTVEAASYGIPVIGRNSGGTSEIIKDNFTGLLHDGSVTDLTSKIELLITNEELRIQIGKNGWEHTKALFNLEKHLLVVKKLFCEIKN